MRVAILGRSELLLNTAHKAISEGHEIALIVTARGEDYYEAKENDFEHFAKVKSIPFILSQTLNSTEIVSKLKESKADIAISVNWPNLIGQEACNAFEHGILNGHAGDLPRYRGNACANWAILNGEEKIILTIHQIDPHGLDTGDIILKKDFSLNSNIYIDEIYKWLREITPSAFCEALYGIEYDLLHPIPQSTNPSESLRCYPRKPEDGRIDWKDSAKEVYALIRATSHPFAGAFCFLESGEKIIIWQAEILEDEPPFCAIPGQILYRIDEFPVVACGEGVLKITVTSHNNAENENIIALLSKSLRARLK